MSKLVLRWREDLLRSLQPQGGALAAWNESDNAPYFTDKPAWDGYVNLIAWACYAEHPDLPRPVAEVTDLEHDPAYAASSGSAPRRGLSSILRRRQRDVEPTRFDQLICGCELWLPLDVPRPFLAQTPAGELLVGSSPRLLSQLNDLNGVTWNADSPTLADWHRAGADAGSPMEVLARFGFSVMHSLAEKAVEHRLPMKLDY